MKPYLVKEKKNFIGRESERGFLQEIVNRNEAAIVVIYGRRRVGKTELLEQVFRQRNILKFEGIEGLSQQEQMARMLVKLSEYLENPLLTKVQINHWGDFFDLLVDVVKKGTWTLYFEELQWLSGYEDRFIAELKPYWDNYFRHNTELLLILCGSSPSFMLRNVLHSKALYNRSQYELLLKQFTLSETKKFLSKRSLRETMDAYLSAGGIPEYLKWINQESSIFLGLCKQAFKAGGFFVNEYERIFISSLSNNPNYQKIIEFLSKRRFASRLEITKHLKIKTGGGISTVLKDLELCGFIEKYTPYNLKENSLLSRYAIKDPYLQFYYKFIKPLHANIHNGDYDQNPSEAIKTDSYMKWLGFSFERFCRTNHGLIAQILGFSSVQYRHGTFFNRASQQENPGYQIDLVFDRDDKVCTICEIKYLQSKVNSKVIKEFEEKLEFFPDREKKTIQKILITTEGADESLLKRGYFDRILTLDDLFKVAV